MLVTWLYHHDPALIRTPLGQHNIPPSQAFLLHQRNDQQKALLLYQKESLSNLPRQW